MLGEYEQGNITRAIWLAGEIYTCIVLILLSAIVSSVPSSPIKIKAAATTFLDSEYNNLRFGSLSIRPS